MVMQMDEVHHHMVLLAPILIIGDFKSARRPMDHGGGGYDHWGLLRHMNQWVDIIPHCTKPIIHLTYSHTYYDMNTRRITSCARHMVAPVLRGLRRHGVPTARVVGVRQVPTHQFGWYYFHISGHIGIFPPHF